MSPKKCQSPGSPPEKIPLRSAIPLFPTKIPNTLLKILVRLLNSASIFNNHPDVDPYFLL